MRTRSECVRSRACRHDPQPGRAANASPAGLYCSTGTITISPGTYNNKITVVAQSVTLPSGNGCGNTAITGLIPYYTGADGQKLLIYTNSNSGLDFTANCNTIRSPGNGGVIFAPNGLVKFDDNNNNIFGFIEAQDITFSMNNTGVFTGTGPGVGASPSTVRYTH